VFPLYLPQQPTGLQVINITRQSVVNNSVREQETGQENQNAAKQQRSVFPPLPAPITPEVVRKVKSDLVRRTSASSLSGRPEIRPRPLSKAKEPSKTAVRSTQRPRKFSLGNIRSRSASIETEYKPGGSMPLPTVRKESLSSEQKKKDDEKTFSVTILVNEHEKNKIVDLLHKAKTIISKKVEKVIGKKPKSSISNVDALQTVLESWMDREQEEEREDHRIVERLIKEQEQQVENLLLSGKNAPVSYRPVPSVEVEDDDPFDEDIEAESDLEVARLTSPRFLHPPIWKSSKISPITSPTRSLSPADCVPCPFGNRPDSELYPPKLRRPSSHYGAGAAAASSRPPSRQVSVSPSVHDFGLESDTEYNELQEIKEASHDGTLTVEEDEWEYEAENEPPTPRSTVRYCRPDSFVIPIGGVWNPREDIGENEIKWGKVDSDKEYLTELKKEVEKEEVNNKAKGDAMVSACLDPVASSCDLWSVCLFPKPSMACLCNFSIIPCYITNSTLPNTNNIISVLFNVLHFRFQVQLLYFS